MPNSDIREEMNRNIREVSAMLHDEIRELREENIRLRNCLSDAADNFKLEHHEFDELKAENVKLRQLASDMLVLGNINGVHLAQQELHLDGGDWRPIAARMRELNFDGFEVD